MQSREANQATRADREDRPDAVIRRQSRSVAGKAEAFPQGGRSKAGGRQIHMVAVGVKQTPAFHRLAATARRGVADPRMFAPLS